MPTWNLDYFNFSQERFNALATGLDNRLEDVVEGRVAPALDDLTLGTARKMRAAVLFFDIRSFSSRTESGDLANMKKALFMLDCVIPMVMHVIYDHGGYVEKNTGDGIMALLGVEESDEEATKAALDAATALFYVLEHIVNPFLKNQNIAPVEARVGIDVGTVLLARLGVPSGSAKHPRNFLTAVGPCANLACHLQQRAGTNEIWTGDQVRSLAPESRRDWFIDVTPPGWTWNWLNDPSRTYRLWHYNAWKLRPE